MFGTQEEAALGAAPQPMAVDMDMHGDEGADQQETDNPGAVE